MPANKGDGRRERKFSSLCVLQHREPEVPNVGWDVSYQELSVPQWQGQFKRPTTDCIILRKEVLTVF
uniref:Uncharacterized protein n=1 Tax=Anguilla anguilla TaxID=7936 RepID=A0A0E9VV47_ANGAN